KHQGGDHITPAQRGCRSDRSNARAGKGRTATWIADRKACGCAQRRGLKASLRDPSACADATRIAGVRLDSRRVEAGDLFVAVPGTRVDGAAFVADARRRGAAAVVCDRAHAPADLPAIVASDVAAAAGYLSSAFYGDPSDALEVVGVTGTNGKTSCTYLLEAVWKAAGKRAGVVGTIVQRCGSFERTSSMTTPSAVDLQALLGEMLGHGCDSVAMEVSSHALDQRRVAGCHFRAALFTNLTRDHLDYHSSEDSYFAAKASLFREYLQPGRGVAVLNADDARVSTLVAELSRHDVWTVSTASGSRARAHVVSAECTLGGIDAVFELGGASVTIRSPLVGAANLSNLLAVAALARATGVEVDAIASGLSACPAVPGRMERIVAAEADDGSGPAVFVDYAHTPDALERSLRALVGEASGRIIVVFGCGGDRDRGKRPIMGRIAAELAHAAVLTSDNPRSEDPHAILEEIEHGIGARKTRRSAAELAARGTGGYLVEADRLVAIETAIAIATPVDVVLIAGKGHEDYQETAGTRRHFDDREVARAMLARRLQGKVAAGPDGPTGR
ncbi:MAG: UDP-N-acetylmuramoyl-L-alanyl-D-glutamate--2,6-diaminopimelate ligase, partial [Candidatus Binatia bacterium]